MCPLHLPLVESCHLAASTTADDVASQAAVDQGCHCIHHGLQQTNTDTVKFSATNLDHMGCMAKKNFVVR